MLKSLTAGLPLRVRCGGGVAVDVDRAGERAVMDKDGCDDDESAWVGGVG